MTTVIQAAARLQPSDLALSEAERQSSAMSGVSWAAVFAGAAGAAALSLILLILGTGLGLSSVSPWAGQGATALPFAVSTILWLTFTQLAASGMGGYLAGRLRSKWAAVHNDEVYFRDTAHGFLAWAVSTLLTAALLTSVIGAILGTGAQAGATVVGAVSTAAAGAATGAAAGTSAVKADAVPSSDQGMGYFVDALFRKDAAASVATVPGADTSPAATGPEVARIFVNGLRAGALPPEDALYVAQRVAQQTGLPQAGAEKRVADIFTRVQTKLRDAETAARNAEDKARKTSAVAALWLFVSLLTGAFVASLCATYGGRRRDL